ncbi:Photosystem I assembly protein Ycf3 [ANME-1 cluster archaeon GoMg1]|nr:Photosystem I assembly protein Ycf3 [ANME-1 cluster archaeon GoMg1]
MVSLLNYKDFVLQLSKEAPHLYRASAIVNDSVAAAQSFGLRTDELKVTESLRHIEEQAVRAQAKETSHIEFGRGLYTKVFGGELGKYFKKCLDEAEKCGAGLRISLRFDENAQEIAALPWEFIYDSDFLSTNRKTLISRLPVGVNRVISSPLESMLRMLVVVSSPNDPTITPLNTELEQEVILEAVDRLQREHRMDVDFTEDASFETIESYLNEKDYHIVHFTGHGKYDKEEGKGYLILETEDDRARAVKNSAIADLLAGRSVRLVVLSACQSGKVSNKEAYADLASILVKKNIPAVVAMQYPILDTSATKFASVFYHAISSGKPVDLALTEARIVLKNSEKSNGIDFATPVLYLSDPDCIAVGKIKPEASALFNKPMMLGEVQMMKKGFVGRRKELRILQKNFMSDVKRAAIIYGFGGIGKTVLATRLALKMSQYFDGIFGMRCSPTTRPEDILNKLNAFLNLAGFQQLNLMLYQPVPLDVKTAALVNILNQKRFLIIFDNFEDCLDETRTNIASLDLKYFIQHLLNNTITNTKFIITSRYNFDPLEGRLTGGIEHISLPELPFPETVWLMNNYKELANLDMKKKQEIYKAIGGHPWAIGQFVRHAAIETVDGLLLELAPLKHELINFTLLDKSYSRLDDKAKALLLRASVYQDAVPVEALSWIMGDKNQPSPSVSEALSILVNWGLIAIQEETEETRYAMHTLVREFTDLELKRENQDRKQLLIRAARYYENLVETTRNLWVHLKAREYYYQDEEWEKADDIVVYTYEYLVRWGHIELAINLLNQSIKATSGTRKAAALGNLATIYSGLGDPKTALKLHAEVKELFEKEGEKPNVAVALHNIGTIHQDQGNYEEAVKLYQQSLKIKEELGNKSGIASSLHQLGIIHQDQGNYEEAVKLYQQSLKIEEELGDKRGIANSLHQLGMIHQNQGNYEEAVKVYQQSLKIEEELGNKRGIASSLHQLGMIHEEKEEFSAALEEFFNALLIVKQLNDPRSKIVESSICRLREKMGEEAFETVLENLRRQHDA